MELVTPNIEQRQNKLDKLELVTPNISSEPVSQIYKYPDWNNKEHSLVSLLLTQSSPPENQYCKCIENGKPCDEIRHNSSLEDIWLERLIKDTEMNLNNIISDCQTSDQTLEKQIPFNILEHEINSFTASGGLDESIISERKKKYMNDIRIKSSSTDNDVKFSDQIVKFSSTQHEEKFSAITAFMKTSQDSQIKLQVSNKMQHKRKRKIKNISQDISSSSKSHQKSEVLQTGIRKYMIAKRKKEQQPDK